jgi:hypothetical protein
MRSNIDPFIKGHDQIMQKILSLIIAGIILCSCARLSASGIVLSSQGKTTYNIGIGQSPTQAETTAAKELAKYLSAVSGAEFKTVKENEIPANTKAIYVGQTQYAKEHEIDCSKLGQEEWIIRTTSDGNLILSGGRPRGTLYAVYEFLEDYVGCHWLDETNEIVPRIETLNIPDLNIQGHPYFGNRQFFDLLDWYPISQIFKVRNKGNCFVGAEYGWGFRVGRPHQHHTFFAYSHTWPKDKPELYALNKEGKRLIATDGGGPGQICMTNPEVRQRVLEELKEFIAQDRKDATAPGSPPYPTVYDISQNDNNDYCQCEKCKALIQKENSPSGPLIDFINTIASGIKKDYPDVFIRTFAYMYSTQPPQNIKVADNVLIHIALMGVEMGNNIGPRDSINSLQHPYNKTSLEIIRKWGEKASNLAIWDYGVVYFSGYFWAPDPYININRFKPDFVFYKDQHVRDLFIESEYPHCTNFFGLKRYLIYKLMQNPDRPTQPIIEEFMNGFYRKAAPKMQELMTYMEKRQGESKRPIGKTNITFRQYLDINYFKTTFGLLDEAERIVRDNPKQAANVRRERIPIISALLMRWHNLGNNQEYFDGQDMLKQYEKISLEAIDYYFPEPDTLTFRKESLTNRDKALSCFRNNLVPVPLPTQFKDCKVVDMPWTCFRTDSGRAKLIDDPEAAGGKAISLGAEVKDRTKNNSTSFEIEDWNEGKMLCAKEIKTKDLPKDEKYHLLKIGRVNFVKDSQANLYCASNREIQCDLYRVFPPKSSYDVYVSVKFQGPEYVPGSTKANAIMVDRAIFVE